LSIPSGSRLGHYEILEPVGEGAMGEVYRAEDRRLGRRVALKVLRAVFSTDRWVLARFEQEARSASALNHPNIVTIYDIGNAGSSFFFAMELIEGRSLREVVREGPLAFARLIRIAVQIADAIACAHAAGIIHRDLKPENIMVTRDDRVKVLDFGIAKLAPEKPLVSTSPTVRIMFPTEPGIIVGTVGYMSPEQAKMEAADHRSDQFSLGAILYEMATGRRAFQKETAVDTLSSILHDEPEPIGPEAAPLPLRWTIARCLAKDREGRYSSSDDLCRDLRMQSERVDEVLATAPAQRGTESGAPGAPRRIRARIALAALLAAVLAAGVGGFLGARRGADGVRSAGPAAAEFSPLTFLPGIESFPSLAPDGKTFVFVGKTGLRKDVFLQRIGGRNAIDLTADSGFDDDQPAFSPDGEQIAFRSERSGGGLFLMGATGESVRRLTTFGFNPSWSPDGSKIVFATEGIFDAATRETSSELWTVEVATGQRRRLTPGDAVQPSWSPHGDRIAYWGLPKGTSRRTIWTIAAGGSGPGAPEPVVADEALNWSPVWAPDGRTLYFASNRSGAMSLWRVGISEKTGRVLGPAQPLAAPAVWSGQAAVSRDGRTLLYTELERRMTLERAAFDLPAAALTGTPERVYDASQGVEGIDVSPDGKSIAFTSSPPNENLFLLRRDGSGLQQLTSGAPRRRGARWSPDGRWISFHSDSGGSYQIWMIHPDGSGLTRATTVPGGLVEARWAPDGARFLALAATDTCVFPGRNPAEPRAACPALPKVNAAGDTFYANDWSPDGGLLAGEVWHAGGVAIPGIVTYAFATHEYRRLTDGGTSPVWLPDGRRLLYLRGPRLECVDTRDGKVRPVGVPRGSADLPIAPESGFALSRNGREIDFVRDATQGEIWQMRMR
jgi:Tol biopolymer transport system component/predicted Ser/Thr protein kinase